MSKDNFADLLPANFDDFRSVEFWNGFFKARNQRAFEWYGEWKQLRSLMLPLIQSKSILTIGCGNSDLSAQMYDEGCTNITNIDFSKPVIKEMMVKNLRQRPLMKWMVMDMTKTKFASDSFDVIVDKGGLDALMGEDTEGSQEAGDKLLAEVQRLLKTKKDGLYLCVTLAQRHVLKKLLCTFQYGWSVRLHQVPPPPDMATSPLQPILAVVQSHTGQPEHRMSLGDAPVEICFSGDPSCSNADQLADILKVVEAENRARQVEGHADNVDVYARLHPGARIVIPCLPSKEAGLEAVASAAEAAKEASAQHGSVESAGVASNGNAAADRHHEASCSSHGSHDEVLGNSPSRFSAIVLDLPREAAEQAVRDCCVFIVPQGREHEWLFASVEGQWAVAADCKSKRTVLVILNRGHTFKGTAAVNRELSPLVKELAPLQLRDGDKKIPILTTDEGIGDRVFLEEAESAINGRIVVEDVKVALPEGEGSRNSQWLRRMVFTSNRNLTQSEAYLVAAPTSDGPSAAASQEKGKPAKKAKGKKVAKGKEEGRTPMVPSYEILASEYHSAMVAGLSLIADGLAQRREAGSGFGRVLVVGLGGGALPMYLHDALGLSVDCVELDPAVAGLARRHFGFADVASLPSLTARVGDGLEAVAELARAAAAPDSAAPVLEAPAPGAPASEAAAGSGGPGLDAGDAGAPKLDVLIVDAGSGDPTLAMSCPPAAFLGARFLTDARAALRADGLLIVNCVSRSAEAFSTAIAAVQGVFAELYELDMDTDVNKVLFAAPQPLPRSIREKVGRGQKAAMQLAARLLPLSAEADGAASSRVPADAPLVLQLQAMKLLGKESSAQVRRQDQDDVQRCV